MCYVMAGFPSKAKAESYAKAVNALGLRTSIWDSQLEMNEAGERAGFNDTDPQTGALADVFPCKVSAPIVLVERFVDEDAEDKATEMVEAFGGEYAGT